MPISQIRAIDGQQKEIHAIAYFITADAKHQ